MASGFTLIDKDTITGVINDTGQTVRVYVPTISINANGDTRANYLGDYYEETALIRPRTNTFVLNEQGAQNEGDALGYFKNDTHVVPECEVWYKENDQYIVYYVISVQPSIFESEQKFLKAILQKRRYEPIDSTDVE